jgi:hypothetical protein
VVKDRSLFRPEMRTTPGACVASPCRMLVELRPLTLLALRIREASIEEIGKTGVVIGERVFEIEDGEAGLLHRRGGKYLQSILFLPSRQGIVALFFAARQNDRRSARSSTCSWQGEHSAGNCKRAKTPCKHSSNTYICIRRSRKSGSINNKLFASTVGH